MTNVCFDCKFPLDQVFAAIKEIGMVPISDRFVTEDERKKKDEFRKLVDSFELSVCCINRVLGRTHGRDAWFMNNK